MIRKWGKEERKKRQSIKNAFSSNLVLRALEHNPAVKHTSELAHLRGKNTAPVFTHQAQQFLAGASGNVNALVYNSVGACSAHT